MTPEEMERAVMAKGQAPPQAQAQSNGHGATSSAGDKPFFFDSPEDLPTVEELSEPEYTDNPGEVIDGVLVEDRETPRSRLSGASERPPPRDPKKTPPDVNEWLDFFSRIVLRSICKLYISFLFKDIDEDALSEREVERLVLSAEEREQIAMPWAEFAYKNKLMRKHGRSVVALAGSFDSFIVLGAWVARVNRIAAKHRPASHTKARKPNVGPRQSEASGEEAGEPGTNGYGGITIINPGTS